MTKLTLMIKYDNGVSRDSSDPSIFFASRGGLTANYTIPDAFKVLHAFEALGVFDIKDTTGLFYGN